MIRLRCQTHSGSHLICRAESYSTLCVQTRYKRSACAAGPGSSGLPRGAQHSLPSPARGHPAGKISAKQKGRPFDNVVELLGNPDDESTPEPTSLKPIEQLLRDLTNLAVTIREDGQVNPLTVVDASNSGIQQFRIETGERRYWAT
jgi:hypothetical protein